MKWQMVQLQQIASEEKGSIVSGPFGSNISAKYFVDEGIPVIRGNNLTKGVQKFIDDGFVYLTETKAAEFRNCIAIKDDIVFTAVGSIGQVGVIPDNTKFEKYVISNKQLRVRIDKKKADPMFVYYWLSCPRMTGYLEGMNNGGAVPLLNLGIIRRVPVPLPPVDTQASIGAVISNFNDSIDNNRRRIRLLEESARLLFREWFVYFRFPGPEKVKIVDGVPEGWGKEHLSKLVTTQYGYTETASQQEIGPKFLRGTDINKTSYIDWASVPYCPNEKLDFRKYSLSRGDILIIRMADPGKVGIVEAEIEAIFASYLVRLKVVNKSISSYYLFYSLLDDKYQGFIIGS
ncbi:MAG: restriction endonuclease subunit S, partial [Candidatus Omnitrophica bacterium]|nr:restriction endonuclease subunit S [Candidatus Omnitrophota bacterium]